MKATLNIYTVKKERKSLSSVSIDKQFSTFSLISFLSGEFVTFFFISLYVSMIIHIYVVLHIHILHTKGNSILCQSKQLNIEYTQHSGCSRSTFFPLFYIVNRPTLLYLRCLISVLFFAQNLPISNIRHIFIHFTFPRTFPLRFCLLSQEVEQFIESIDTHHQI